MPETSTETHIFYAVSIKIVRFLPKLKRHDNLSLNCPILSFMRICSHLYVHTESQDWVKHTFRSNMKTSNKSWQKHLIQPVIVSAGESHSQTGVRLGKVHPRTGQESPEVEKRCSSTLNHGIRLGEGGDLHHVLATFYVGKRPGTHCTGIQSPDCPACSESLFQLSYPGPSDRCSNYPNLHEGRPTFLMKESWHNL
jgi:hypothetical protein